jgi:flavin-dependent dehydrogenase
MSERKLNREDLLREIKGYPRTYRKILIHEWRRIYRLKGKLRKVEDLSDEVLEIFLQQIKDLSENDNRSEDEGENVQGNCEVGEKGE